MFETRPFQSCLIKFGSVISEQNLKMWKANENGHTPVTPSNGKRSYSLMAKDPILQFPPTIKVTPMI